MTRMTLLAGIFHLIVISGCASVSSKETIPKVTIHSSQINMDGALKVLSIPSFGYSVSLDSYLIEMAPVKELCASIVSYAITLGFNKENIDCDRETDGSFIAIETSDGLKVGVIFARAVEHKSELTSIYDHERYHALRRLGSNDDLDGFHELISLNTDRKIDLSAFEEEDAAMRVTILSHLANGAAIQSIVATGWALDIVREFSSLKIRFYGASS